MVSCESRDHASKTFDSQEKRHFGLFRFNSDWTRQFVGEDLTFFTRCFFPISTLLTIKMSLARQNYHEECEAGINKQINLELYASYVYMSMVRLRFFIQRERSVSFSANFI